MGRIAVFVSVVIVLLLAGAPTISTGLSTHVMATSTYNWIESPQSTNSYHYAPIAISTTSNSSLLIYQQMITINRASFPEINSVWSNIEFRYNNGTSIYAWIQSFNSSNANIWLRLAGAENRTIYLLIYPSSVSFLSPTGYLGEAPQLSEIYGEYWNAPLVFGQKNATDFVNQTEFTKNWMLGGASVKGFDGLTISNGISSELRNMNAIASSQAYDTAETYLLTNARAFPNASVWRTGFGMNNVSQDSFWVGATDFNVQTYNETGVGSASSQVGIANEFYTMILHMLSNGTGATLSIYNNSFAATLTDYANGFGAATLNGFIQLNSGGGTWEYIIFATVPDNLMPSYTIRSAVSAYNVKFSETGLIPGSHWLVSMDNVTVTSDSSYLSFLEENGSYSFRIGNLTDYSGSPSYGEVQVNGSNINIPISFTQLITLTFFDLGLPPGIRWSVIVNNTSYSSTASPISVTLPNSTYAFEVRPPPGYSANILKGHLGWNNSYIIISMFPLYYVLEIFSAVAALVALLFLFHWIRTKESWQRYKNNLFSKRKK